MVIALILGLAIILAMANAYHAGRQDAEARITACPSCPAIPTPGTKDFPSAILKATPTPAPTISSRDPAFWRMLTPEGQSALSAVTVIINDWCTLYWPAIVLPGNHCKHEVGELCRFYYGGVYQAEGNRILLCGDAAQANPDILRHEALHALDAADDMATGQGSPFQKLANGDLAAGAETLYNAGGGTWFRPGELYAMVPLVVGWRFDLLPPGICAYYADWFLEAARICPVMP